MNVKIIEEIKNYGCDMREGTPSLLQFSPFVRSACEQNTCGCWGTNWRCPPGCGTVEELRKTLQSYSKMLILSKVVHLKDPFDVESMEEGRILLVQFLRTLNHRYQLTLNHYMILGIGACELCQPCPYPHEECRHPHDSFTSLEAAGVDVVTLSKTVGLTYHSGVNTVTYFAAILYNEDQ